jgi:hypothetical protein
MPLEVGKVSFNLTRPSGCFVVVAVGVGDGF